MYHTIETRLPLDPDLFYAYKDHLAKSSMGEARFYEDSEFKGEGRLWHSELLSDKGVHITLANFIPKGYRLYFLILRINPKRLLNNYDFISATHESETEMIYAEMNKLLYSIEFFVRFEEFKISRIDYCCNYTFENGDVARHYIDLLKRSAILYGFDIKLTYSVQQHRKIDNKNAVYAYNKSVNINIYDKYQEMCERPESYQINLEDCHGIIRFEIQCLTQKIHSMKYSNELPDRTASHWMKEDLSEKTILFYINKIFVIGDYWTLAVARQKVHEANFRNDTKEAMLKLLELSNRKRSLTEALKSLYQEGLSKNYWKSILDRFEMINVNPVTIPVNWGISHFDSPYNIVAMEIERNREF